MVRGRDTVVHALDPHRGERPVQIGGVHCQRSLRNDGIWTGRRPQPVGRQGWASSDRSQSGRACAEPSSRPRAPRSGGGAERRALRTVSTRRSCGSDDAPATTISWGRRESRIGRFLAVANIHPGRRCRHASPPPRSRCAPGRAPSRGRASTRQSAPWSALPGKTDPRHWPAGARAVSLFAPDRYA